MQIPKDPQRGMPIKDDFLALKRFMLASRIVGVEGGTLRETPNGTTIRINPPAVTNRDTLPPFTVRLNRNDDDSWTATVTPGLVCERVTTDADALISHEPVGITSGGAPVQHTVAAGESLAVKVSILDTGAIGIDEGNAVEIAVISTGTESEHYKPHPVGNQASGATGIKYYVLADFVADGDLLKKTPKLEGSHIDHWRELPMFESVGGYVDIFKEFDQTDGRYKVRTVKGVDGISVEEDGDTIKVSPDTGFGSHPWKATPNGDEFINIAAGKGLGIKDSGTPGTTPWNFVYVSYAGGAIEVTAATGYIYVIFGTTQRAIGEDATGDGYISASREPTSATVQFSEDDPTTVNLATTDEICIPIAEVALAGGVASVVDQILTHNPMLTVETTVSMP